MIDYIYSYYNLKLASFEDISNISAYTSEQKKVLYRSFVNYLKNIKNNPIELNKLLSLFKTEKIPTSSATLDTLNPSFVDFIKTNYKLLNNDTYGGITNFGNILNFFILLLKKNIILKENLNNPQTLERINNIINKNPQLKISFSDFKKFIESNIIDKVKDIYINHIKKTSANYNTEFMNKCIDLYLKTESSLAYVGKTPIEIKNEETEKLKNNAPLNTQESFENQEDRTTELDDLKGPETKEQLNKDILNLESKTSSIKFAVELSQSDYTLFTIKVLPEFFKLWLEAQADIILEKSGLSQKIQIDKNIHKEETTDATGAILRIGDKVKPIPTFSGEDDTILYIVENITNGIDVVEQDPTKRLDYVSLKSLTAGKQIREPHYMVIKVEEQIAASTEIDDLLIHQAIYDVLIKEAQSTGTDIDQKTMEDLNPGENARAVDPNGNEVEVSVNQTGDVNLGNSSTSNSQPLTASKEVIPQLEEKGYRLVQEQV